MIDTSVFCGYWPFRRLSILTPRALKLSLTRCGVTQAWVAASEAIFYPDPRQANLPLFEAIAKDSFFKPVAMLDVTLPAWRRDLKEYFNRWGCRIIKLTPNYHQYELQDPRVEELATIAGEMKTLVCVQLRMMDERGQHPLMKVPAVPVSALVQLSRQHPNVRFLACGATQDELEKLRGTNVLAEISFVESGQALYSAMTSIGPGQLVFGSHSPFFYIEAVAAKLDVAPEKVPPAQVNEIRTLNARALLAY